MSIFLSTSCPINSIILCFMRPNEFTALSKLDYQQVRQCWLIYLVLMSLAERINSTCCEEFFRYVGEPLVSGSEQQVHLSDLVKKWASLSGVQGKALVFNRYKRCLPGHFQQTPTWHSGVCYMSSVYSYSECQVCSRVRISNCASVFDRREGRPVSHKWSPQGLGKDPGQDPLPYAWLSEGCHHSFRIPDPLSRQGKESPGGVIRGGGC